MQHIEFSPLTTTQKFFPVWRVDVPYIKQLDTTLLDESKWIVDDIKSHQVKYTDTQPEQKRFWYESRNCDPAIKKLYEIFGEKNILQHLDKLFLNDENYILIDKLYQYNRHNDYARPSEWLVDKIECEHSIAKDIQGMTINDHVDTRIYFGTFVVNLIDNTSSTVFVNANCPGPLEKGTGVFFLNDVSTLHRIDHLENNDRLISYTQIRFKVLD